MPVMSFLRSEGGALTAQPGIGVRGQVPDAHMVFSSAVVGGFDPVGNMKDIYDVLNLDDEAVSYKTGFDIEILFQGYCFIFATNISAENVYIRLNACTLYCLLNVSQVR